MRLLSHGVVATPTVCYDWKVPLGNEKGVGPNPENCQVLEETTPFILATIF